MMVSDWWYDYKCKLRYGLFFCFVWNDSLDMILLQAFRAENVN